jgi:alpha-ribazole phosphatase
MRLHLVRHPRIDLPGALCYGSSDVSAAFDDRFLQSLLSMLPSEALLFSSPLKRCAVLAEALAPALGCGAPVYDERLVEMHFGAWELCAWDDIPRSEVDAWAADPIHYCPGGGESVLQVAQRVRAFRDELARLNAEDIIVICHAGTIRLLLAGERGCSLEEDALFASQSAHRIEHGAVTVLECAP